MKILSEISINITDTGIIGAATCLSFAAIIWAMCWATKG